MSGDRCDREGSEKTATNEVSACFLLSMHYDGRIDFAHGLAGCYARSHLALYLALAAVVDDVGSFVVCIGKAESWEYLFHWVFNWEHCCLNIFQNFSLLSAFACCSGGIGTVVCQSEPSSVFGAGCSVM